MLRSANSRTSAAAGTCGCTQKASSATAWATPCCSTSPSEAHSPRPAAVVIGADCEAGDGVVPYTGAEVLELAGVGAGAGRISMNTQDGSDRIRGGEDPACLCTAAKHSCTVSAVAGQEGVHVMSMYEIGALPTSTGSRLPPVHVISESHLFITFMPGRSGPGCTGMIASTEKALVKARRTKALPKAGWASSSLQ